MDDEGKSSGMIVLAFQLYDGKMCMEIELSVLFLRRLLFAVRRRVFSIWNMEGLLSV